MKNLNKLSKLCIIGLIAIITTALFTCCSHHERKKHIHTEVQVEEPTYLTVQDVLELREDLRHMKYIDSVYLAMPEQVLINILITKGTDIPIKDIVELYISNKEFYDNLIKKAMDIQKKYIPDSIPKSSIPEINSDTLHTKIF